MVTAEPTSADVFAELESEVRSYCRAWPTVFTRARGAVIEDEAGRSYIDFFAGAGGLNYGHNPPQMIAALIDYLQSGGILHSLDMSTAAKRDFLLRFEETILAPRGMRYRVQFPGPTGANAVEAALKLARKVTGRRTVVSFTNAFHGMTLGALAVSANPFKREGAGDAAVRVGGGAVEAQRAEFRGGVRHEDAAAGGAQHGEVVPVVADRQGLRPGDAGVLRHPLERRALVGARPQHIEEAQAGAPGGRRVLGAGEDDPVADHLPEFVFRPAAVLRSAGEHHMEGVLGEGQFGDEAGRRADGGQVAPQPFRTRIGSGDADAGVPVAHQGDHREADGGGDRFGCRGPGHRDLGDGDPAPPDEGAAVAGQVGALRDAAGEQFHLGEAASGDDREGHSQSVGAFQGLPVGVGDLFLPVQQRAVEVHGDQPEPGRRRPAPGAAPAHSGGITPSQMRTRRRRSPGWIRSRTSKPRRTWAKRV